MMSLPCLLTTTTMVMMMMMVITTTIVEAHQIAATRSWRNGGDFAVVLGEMGSGASDKMTQHRYQFMYSKYLDPLQDQHLTFLEIGIGCAYPHGPGHSARFFRRYMPNSHGFFMDYGPLAADCRQHMERASYMAPEDKKYMGLGERDLYGDQGNETNLKEVILKRHIGGYHKLDFAIDDGGHRMNHNIVSFNVLMDVGVKPGGLYIVEDLQTSFWGGRFVTKEQHQKGYTMVGMINSIMEYILLGGAGEVPPMYANVDAVKNIHSFECDREICVFQKREAHTL
eukprot:PhM_4_TR3147/c0_g1_i2/m.66147